MLVQPRGSIQEKRENFPPGNPYLKNHFFCSHWFLCYAMTRTDFSFHFLPTFWPCLFVYLSSDFFFSWFHWWIWSISSLPCQWKTHQPFVQADIPVSIVSYAKRLCMPLSLTAQGCHWFGVFPPRRLISPAGFSGMEGTNKLQNTRKGETAFAQPLVSWAKLGWWQWGLIGNTRASCRMLL